MPEPRLFFLFVIGVNLISVYLSSAADSTPEVQSSPADSNQNSPSVSESVPKDDKESEQTQDDSSTEEKDSDVDEEFDDDYDQNPAMTCLLFGTTGCSAECRLRAVLYGSYGEGTCTDNQTCQCDSKLVSFYQHFDKRFNSVYTYRAILDDDDLYKKTMQIFSNPLRTGKQYKELLKPYLSPYEYIRLKVADRTLAGKFTTDDQPDKEGIRKFIDEKLNLLPKKSVQSLLKTNYKENFEQTLKNTDNKGTLYNISARLAQMQNETLNDIFEKNLKERNVTKPEIKQQSKRGLDEVFEDVFVDFIISRNDQRSSAAKKSLPSEKRKPPVKSTPIKEPVKEMTRSKSTQEKRPRAAKKL